MWSRRGGLAEAIRSLLLGRTEIPSTLRVWLDNQSCWIGPSLRFQTHGRARDSGQKFPESIQKMESIVTGSKREEHL
jgi:hypothetical protein